jgi:hypothetical protein
MRRVETYTAHPNHLRRLPTGRVIVSSIRRPTPLVVQVHPDPLAA